MSPPRLLAPGQSPLLFLGPTIFGRTEFDLAGSMGPVPSQYVVTRAVLLSRQLTSLG